MHHLFVLAIVIIIINSSSSSINIISTIIILNCDYLNLQVLPLFISHPTCRVMRLCGT